MTGIAHARLMEGRRRGRPRPAMGTSMYRMHMLPS